MKILTSTDKFRNDQHVTSKVNTFFLPQGNDVYFMFINKEYMESLKRTLRMEYIVNQA